MSDMTRAEAIKDIQGLKITPSHYESISMALEALRKMDEIEDAIHNSPNAADDILYIIDAE